MITDDFLLFANASAQVRAAGSYVSANVLDLQSQRDIGAGERLMVYFNVDIAFVGGTDVTFQIITADDSAMLTNVTVLAATGAIPVASLGVGQAFALGIPPAPMSAPARRYMAVRAVSTGVFSSGSYSARIVLDAYYKRDYPSGSVIL